MRRSRKTQNTRYRLLPCVCADIYARKRHRVVPMSLSMGGRQNANRQNFTVFCSTEVLSLSSAPTDWPEATDRDRFLVCIQIWSDLSCRFTYPALISSASGLGLLPLAVAFTGCPSESLSSLEGLTEGLEFSGLSSSVPQESLDIYLKKVVRVCEMSTQVQFTLFLQRSLLRPVVES